MEHIELTPEEETQRSILAAFDSVNLIYNNLEDQETLNRNIEHLKVMMAKDWFVNGLTTQQALDINNCII
jgi:hypothetical protein